MSAARDAIAGAPRIYSDRQLDERLFPVVCSELSMNWYLHGLDSIESVLDGLDLDELGSMWQKKLVHDF